MGIYNKRKSISRGELKESFRKHHGRIPGTGGKKYYQRERERIVKEVFGPKYGSKIDTQDYRGAVRDLQSAKRMVKTPRERRAIDEKIRYLKEFGGKNI